MNQIKIKKASPADLETLKEKVSIWLGVWEENSKAIHFYEKNGFTAFDKHIFKLGNDEQTDIMMRKILEETIFPPRFQL